MNENQIQNEQKEDSKRPMKRLLYYPDQTNGTRLAAEIRQRANKLTPEQRREHFRQAIDLSTKETL